MMILILGCLDLICIPLGTALGIYTIWIFMHSERTGAKVTNEESVINIDKQSTSIDMKIPLPGKRAQI